ncbi:spore germination protein [Paenibacillus sp. KQZ6P-2]|uniref:Spore germination protein n=1 Tax=Paenibacillus mangrovi TaxID=2931978 RepID=A0A9X1WRF5_9BACL|nr:spore germination protein [Paenibacillus mangrovi]MCJ8013673.1 spore germination protein [Paenibacillus mangrovi]
MKPSSQTIFSTVDQNITYIQDALFHTDDLKIRHHFYKDMPAALVYLESLVDPILVERNIIAPLRLKEADNLSELFTTMHLEVHERLEDGIQGLMQGYCLYFVKGKPVFYTLTAPANYDRSITEPENEAIIRGAHNGFIENLTVNLFLLRQQISVPDLTVKYFNIGNTAPRRVAMIYMHNLTEQELVQKVEKRLKSISLDAIMSAGFIQELIEDNPHSIFPQHLNTERPDHTGAYLMDGHVVMMLEGDPTALIVPVSFFAFYQTPDDYNNRWMIASFVRFIRLLSFITAFQLPAFYIAIVSFHSDVLPIQLFFTVQGSLTRVPYPPLMEAMLLELIFEFLREAGLRLPSRVGQTIGIVGGLVIGDAIVKAGFVSYTMIIVVAMTAISSFLIPSNEMSSAIRILRFPLMIAASLFGFIGISFGLTILFIHLCKLESFGKPYLFPVAPLKMKNFKDAFMRFPIWRIRKKADGSPK